MRTRLRHIRSCLRVLSQPVGFVFAHLARLSGRRLGLAVVYHGVAPSTGDPARELVPAHGVKLFESQVRHLARSYRLVPASKLCEAITSRRRGERIPATITFDDDLASHRRFAMPILLRHGAPATFFLCGRSLDRPFAFWWEHLQEAHDRGLPIATLAPGGGGEGDIASVAFTIMKLGPEAREPIARQLRDWVGPDPEDAGMREEDVRALAEMGFEIGFHTLNHDYLPSVPDAGLPKALSEGRPRLEEAAGQALVAVAYPHGEADERVVAAARSANFRAGFTTDRRAVTARTDPLLQGRLEPSFISTGHFATEAMTALARCWKDR